MINLSDWQPTIGQIAAAIKCPVPSVGENWALILLELEDLKIGDVPTQIATLATVAVETAHTFQPVLERGSFSYFQQHYWENIETRHALGNIQQSDASVFSGKGFIQLTGRANFTKYSRLCNLPLVDKPSLMLQPKESARVCARFIYQSGVWEHARAACAALTPDLAELEWQKTRKLVNGGLNGYQEYRRCVTDLLLLRLTSTIVKEPVQTAAKPPATDGAGSSGGTKPLQ